MSAPEKDTEELLAERQRVDDAPPAEDREQIERGEADQTIPADG